MRGRSRRELRFKRYRTFVNICKNWPLEIYHIPVPVRGGFGRASLVSAFWGNAVRDHSCGGMDEEKIQLPGFYRFCVGHFYVTISVNPVLPVLEIHLHLRCDYDSFPPGRRVLQVTK